MDILKDYISSLGADLIGFADISEIPNENRYDMPYAVSIGIALNPTIVSLIPKAATLEYYNEYCSVTEKLDIICLAVENYLTDRGYGAIAQTTLFARKQRENYRHGLSEGNVLLPHKTVAALSGLGWISKSSLLVTKQYGSAVRFTSVLTNAPIEATKAEYSCRCGNCSICADACPGKAIKNKKWDINVERDELIDIISCKDAIKNRGIALGLDNASCGICVAACPYTKKYLKGIYALWLLSSGEIKNHNTVKFFY